MLKRIKIRGKLLLLLSVPLIAVLVFAASGVLDRQQQAGDRAREARLADLADAGADLTLAIDLERFGTIQAARLGVTLAPMASDQATTNEAFDRWSASLDSLTDDFADPILAERFLSLRDRLIGDLAEDREQRGPVAVEQELGSNSADLSILNRSLAAEAETLELFQALQTYSQLVEVEESVSTIAFIGFAAVDAGQMSVTAPALIEAEVQRISATLETVRIFAADRYLDLVEGLQTDGVLPRGRIVGSATDAGGFRPAVDILEAVYQGQEGGAVAWVAASEERLEALNDVVDTILQDATVEASVASDRATSEANSFLILAASVFVFAVLMALFVGRSVSRPLIRLTRSAEQLSGEELPAMVEAMRSSGQSPAPHMTAIKTKGRDEVAQLARAFAEIQTVTIEVAEEQGELLRRGISDIFVNLARRNQSLLDRQIEFIDQLESREENPDQLENLFRLDHLATRMRRNAESLLVLAGAEPTRRRGRPVELSDVVRVAMGEIEDFSRIHLMSLDSATVAGSVAVDLAHVMSELMENATQFSPPESDVEVVGHRTVDGGYHLTLTDRGIGMSAEQLTQANETLEEPPVIGLDLSRSLGFTVISRLADRLGVTVRLSTPDGGGVTALVTVPAEMVGIPEAGANSRPTSQPAASTLATPAPPVATGPPPAPPTPLAPEFPPIAGVPDDPPVLPTRRAAEPATSNTDGLAELPMRRPAAVPEPTAATPAAAAPFDPVIAEPVSLGPDSADPDPSSGPTTPLGNGHGDLFEVFAPTEQPPAGPKDPAGDLFAAITEPSLDDVPVVPPLPTATPRDADETPQPGSSLPTPPTPPNPPTLTGPTAFANPPVSREDSAAPTDGGLPLEALPVPMAEPADSTSTPPSRSAAEVGAVDHALTSAGLIRRTPRQVEVAEHSKYVPGARPPQTVTPATRSPEEVRQMLSRYRAGLRKGRGPDKASQSNRRS